MPNQIGFWGLAQNYPSKRMPSGRGPRIGGYRRGFWALAQNNPSRSMPSGRCPRIGGVRLSDSGPRPRDAQPHRILGPSPEQPIKEHAFWARPQNKGGIEGDSGP